MITESVYKLRCLCRSSYQAGEAGPEADGCIYPAFPLGMTVDLWPVRIQARTVWVLV
jgi:hypothetical protein